jgi:hypothetical protein
MHLFLIILLCIVGVYLLFGCFAGLHMTFSKSPAAAAARTRIERDISASAGNSKITYYVLWLLAYVYTIVGSGAMVLHIAFSKPAAK